MKGKGTLLGGTVMIIVIGMVMAGCATGPSASPTKSQPDLLNEAGFRMYTPSSSQHLAYIQTLPAKKVVSNNYQGKVHYLVCTNPDAKQCFLGDEAAYQRYQQLAVQQSIAEEHHKVSEERSDPEFWGLWISSQGGR
jgi:hypothetical protein